MFPLSLLTIQLRKYVRIRSRLLGSLWSVHLTFGDNNLLIPEKLAQCWRKPWICEWELLPQVSSKKTPQCPSGWWVLLQHVGFNYGWSERSVTPQQTKGWSGFKLFRWFLPFWFDKLQFYGVFWRFWPQQWGWKPKDIKKKNQVIIKEFQVLNNKIQILIKIWYEIIKIDYYNKMLLARVMHAFMYTLELNISLS